MPKIFFTINVKLFINSNKRESQTEDRVIMIVVNNRVTGRRLSFRVRSEVLDMWHQMLHNFVENRRCLVLALKCQLLFGRVSA